MELSRLMSDEAGAKRQLEIEYGQPNKRTRFQLPIHPSAVPYIPQENEIICYGMLADDVIQFKRPPKPAELDVMTTKVYGDNRSYFEIDINLQDELGIGTLKITDDRDLGVLSTHTFRALKALHDKYSISFRPVIHEEEWEEKMESMSEKASWTRISVDAKLNVIVFGPRLAGTDVAKILAKEGRFLQDPIPGSFDCPYENPQSLPLPEVEETANSQLESSLRNTGTTDEFALDDQEHHTNVPPQPDPVSFMDRLDTVMNNLPTHDNLPHVSVDSSVITKLLTHQQKGLDFISKREQGVNIPDRSLWQKISDMEDDGEDCYQHEITGAKSPTPADCLGGIIADDMGLGKTLTMLSAIINSIPAAHAFGLQTTTGEVAKSTIVIVPSELLLRTWATEINKHLYPGTLRFNIYHGAERRQEDANLRDHDIILTTYGTAMAEFRKRTGVLYRTTWYRLILDEAHMIRNSASKQFEAVNKIQSHIRWCLSGTPIQNSLEDLGSIVRFLSVPVLDNPATFRKYIFSEQAPGEPAGEPYQNLRRLLGSICLRRNMSALPDMTYDTDHKHLEFAPAERQQYEGMELTLRRLIKFAVTQQQKGSTHRLKVMEAFLRLRMFCNNGLEESVNVGILTPGSQPDEILSVLQQSRENLCASCSIDVQAVNGPEDSDAGYLTRCFKVFCHECSGAYKERFRRSNSLTCPLCEKDHGIDDLVNADISTTTSGASSQYPSKIKALVDDVQVNYLKGKCVIFSFWKRTLDVVAKVFKDHDIKFSRIDGDVTPKKRNTILTEFQNRSASRVLIMTFSTGGVGLNGLTVADRIHILEPQWNPAVEKQAIGRVLRLDQRKRVTVVRYVMRKTIEEAVQSQQQRKIQIAGGGFANDRDQRDLKVNQLMQLGNFLNTSIGPNSHIPITR